MSVDIVRWADPLCRAITAHAPANARARAAVSESRRTRAAASASGPVTTSSTSASANSSAVSRTVCKWGPTTRGKPSPAGSSRLCPPTSTSVPPTKATSASPYNDDSSPIVSTTRHSGSAASEGRLRRPTRSPARSTSLITSGTRSGWRGTKTARKPETTAATATQASRISSSSPGCVLPNTAMGATGSKPCSVRSGARVGIEESTVTLSYFRFPTTSIREAWTPSVLSRSAYT